MKFRWDPKASPGAGMRAVLQKELAISPLLAECLLNRGLAEPELAQRFLRPRLHDLADPFLLPNMTGAVTRLVQAREAGEALVIFGDYDVDGITATALLTEVLRQLGWKVDFYLPQRLEEGYGLSQEGVRNCLQKFPVSLLLAVDCGSTAVDVIAALGQEGVDVIVLDHHQVSTPPPPAVAVVNPQLATSERPSFRELCSAGLAFKLAHALVKQGRTLGWPAAAQLDLREFLDLVALGTIADLVPLLGENRILVNRGLERLNATTRPGLVALKKVAEITRPITGYEVGFQLAPRLNAAGRLEHALEALQLLLTADQAEAERIAFRLDAQNRERQKIERSMAETVIGAVRARFDPARDFVVVEGQLLWHVGVVGIVASRVVQEFHRPAIILGGSGDEWRGSGRSVEGFDLAAALRGCSGLLLRHGGHAMAAGLSMAPHNLDSLRQSLNELVRQTLTPEQLVPRLRLDAEVSLSAMTLEAVRELQLLQQTGMDNPPVQLFARNLALRGQVRRLGTAQQHAKLWVADEQITREAVWWGAGTAPLPAGKFDLAFVPEINTYNGDSRIQLRILDWRPVGLS